MLLGGVEMKVEFLEDRAVKPSVSKKDSVIIVRVNRIRDAAPLLYEWTRKKASLSIRQSVWRNSRSMGVQPGRISIRDQQSRWGSCSHYGNLNFNFRIGMAPPEVMEYVVIHELVHTKIKNHSKAFWSEVGRFCPNYKERQKWLRYNARLLRIPTPTLDQIRHSDYDV
ncbi:MAG: M48 family metallopeptidase [Nitrososphaerota archaeon]|jgi:predicted metal-dependent hydrolase|nr:M48 family metallopeptidase [Nitrososphaerota archaeon]